MKLQGKLKLLVGILVWIPTFCMMVSCKENSNTNQTQVNTNVTISQTSSPTSQVVLTQTKVQTKTPRPTITPAPTKTLTPTITQTPTPYYSFSTGPWVVLLRQRWDVDPVPLYFLCKLDFSDCVPLPIQADANIHLSQRPGFLTALTSQGELWVLRLPDLQIIRQIALLSYNISPKNIRWSPDGRYLAYSGGTSGGDTDLYLYDLEKDAISHVSWEPESVRLMAWSPDSRWLIYAEVQPDSAGGTESVKRILGIIPGGNSLVVLQEADGSEVFGKWINSQSFLVAGKSPEGWQENLREVDLESGEIRSIYPYVFDAFDFDPQSQTVYVYLQKWVNRNDKDAAGMYAIRLVDGQKQLAWTPGTTWLRFDGWIPEWSSFNMADPLTLKDEYPPKDIVKIMDLEGNTRYEFEAYEFSISPDREWFAVSRFFGVDLYNKNGMLEKRLWGGALLYWMKDMRGLWTVFSDAADVAFYFYLADTDWGEAFSIPDWQAFGILYARIEILYP